MIRGLISGVVGSGSGSSSGAGWTAPTPLKTFDFTDPNADLSDFTITRASTKTYWNSAGILATAAINECPIWYDPETLIAEGIKRESASTNLCLYSEDLTHASYTKTDITITPNAMLAPDGNTTMDLVTEGSAGTASTSYAFTTTANTEYAASVFARSYSGNDWMCVTLWDGTNGVRAWYNLRTKKMGSKVVLGSGLRTQYFLKPCGSLGVRISVTARNPSTTTYLVFHSADADGSTTRVPNAAYGVWGVFPEANGYATSYIPTFGTTVTRAADSISVTNLASKSWFVASDGAVAVDFRNEANNPKAGSDLTPLYFSGTAGNYLLLERDFQYSFGRYHVECQNAYATNVDMPIGVENSGVIYGMNKNDAYGSIALGWANNNVRACFGDSTAIYKDSSATIPTLTSFSISTCGGFIRSIRFYGGLSDADLKLTVKNRQPVMHKTKKQLIARGALCAQSQTNSSALRVWQCMLEMRPPVGVSNPSVKWAHIKSTTAPPSGSHGVVNGVGTFKLSASIAWGGYSTSTCQNWARLLFDGKDSITVNPGDVVEGIAEGVTIPPGYVGGFFVVWRVEFDTAPATYTRSYLYLDGGVGNANYAVDPATLPDKTASPTWGAEVPINFAPFPPIGLFGNPEKELPVVCIPGDSITCVGDNDDANYARGWAQRALYAAGIPFVYCGEGGKSGFEWTRSQSDRLEHVKAWELIRDCGTTFIIYALGTNDISWVGETTESVKATYARFELVAKSYGIDVVPCTVPPITSNDNTTERPEYPGSWVDRAGYNTWVRTLTRYIDVAAACEDGSTNLWISGYYYPGGIHPSPTGHAAIAAAVSPLLPALVGVVTP